MRRSSVPRSSTRWRSACRSGRSTGCGWRSWRGSATRAPLAELERRALLVADGTDDGVGAVRVGNRAADDEAGVWEDPGEGRPGAGRVAGYARSRADEGGPRGSAVERQRARTEHLARVGGGRAVDRAAAGPACARGEAGGAVGRSGRASVRAAIDVAGELVLLALADEPQAAVSTKACKDCVVAGGEGVPAGGDAAVRRDGHGDRRVGRIRVTARAKHM